MPLSQRTRRGRIRFGRAENSFGDRINSASLAYSAPARNFWLINSFIFGVHSPSHSGLHCSRASLLAAGCRQREALTRLLDLRLSFLRRSRHFPLCCATDSRPRPSTEADLGSPKLRHQSADPLGLDRILPPFRLVPFPSTFALLVIMLLPFSCHSSSAGAHAKLTSPN